MTTNICSYKIGTLGGRKGMAQAIVEGVYMGHNVKTSNYDGVEKTAIYIDVYQQDSEDADKTVSIKTDDLTLVNTLSKDFSMGSIFKAACSINAYKNKAYFKLNKLFK